MSERDGKKDEDRERKSRGWIAAFTMVLATVLLLGVLALALLFALVAVPAQAAPASKAPDAKPEIINGSASNPGTYSFLVALLDSQRYASQGAFQAQFCGGTLTTPSTIVVSLALSA